MGETANTLDLVISDDPGRVDEIEYQSPLGKSDHAVLLFHYIIKYSRDNNQKISYQYNRGDYKSINQQLNLNWDEMLQDKDVEKQWQIIKAEILDAEQKHVPVFDTSKQNKWRMKGSVPISPEIRKEVKLKHRLWTRYYETRDDNKYQNYGAQRNKVCRLIVSAKRY